MRNKKNPLAEKNKSKVKKDKGLKGKIPNKICLVLRSRKRDAAVGIKIYVEHREEKSEEDKQKKAQNGDSEMQKVHPIIAGQLFAHRRGLIAVDSSNNDIKKGKSNDSVKEKSISAQEFDGVGQKSARLALV